ncbi:MAG TPA: phosphotransferase [Anaerolineales bacterium]|nr:phosphotransferase [Anaerolineales bacterium]
MHQTESHWHNEVHAYEKWAGVFGDFAPRLLAVREEAPCALIVSELPGQIVEHTPLALVQEQSVWRAAGAALAVLHDFAIGDRFGPCLRDGSCAEAFPQNAREYVSQRFKRQIDRAVPGGYISDDELGTLHAAFDLVPAFEGERPVPCHRDYCAANWLVNTDGVWTGVIDFEFAYWDVRVADLSRDPNWCWIGRPDLIEAFCEGYGRSLSPLEEQQLLVAHAEYALGAILWGRDHAFYGFEREGHESLAHLTSLLN